MFSFSIGKYYFVYDREKFEIRVFTDGDLIDTFYGASPSIMSEDIFKSWCEQWYKNNVE